MPHAFILGKLKKRKSRKRTPLNSALKHHEGAFGKGTIRKFSLCLGFLNLYRVLKYSVSLVVPLLGMLMQSYFSSPSP